MSICGFQDTLVVPLTVDGATQIKKTGSAQLIAIAARRNARRHFSRNATFAFILYAMPNKFDAGVLRNGSPSIR